MRRGGDRVSIKIKLSTDAASDTEATLAVLRKFVGSHVTVSTPNATAEGEIKNVDWSEEHEEYGFFLGSFGDPSPGEFIAFNYDDMEVTYS